MSKACDHLPLSLHILQPLAPPETAAPAAAAAVDAASDGDDAGGEVLASAWAGPWELPCSPRLVAASERLVAAVLRASVPEEHAAHKVGRLC